MKKINWKYVNSDAVLITNPKNIKYFTEAEVSVGYLLITKRQKYLYVDSRYFEAVEKLSQNNKLFKAKLLVDRDKKLQAHIEKFYTVAFESDFLTVDAFNNLQKKYSIKTWRKISSDEIRVIKDEDEIKKMDKAGKISFKALEWIIDWIKPGVTEIEVSNKLKEKMIEFGADGIAFESIVASGKQGSSPHHHPNNKKIKSGEFVTIDFGAKKDGYCADITRTITIGKQKDEKLLEIYNVVKEAQRAGIEAVKSGVETKQIDAICRRIIRKAGYEEYFNHGTGHGLGMEVHELPYVTSRSELNRKLKVGNVITVEPGIYIPNLGGVRIEDDILVTKTGYKILGKNNITYLK
ncbi:MAG: aminopeptidase P family protein [Mycoplasma sp.]|nr:aminopeptidase P family protein [Mycoplasma sp.]